MSHSIDPRCRDLLEFLHRKGGALVFGQGNMAYIAHDFGLSAEQLEAVARRLETDGLAKVEQTSPTSLFVEILPPGERLLKTRTEGSEPPEDVRLSRTALAGYGLAAVSLLILMFALGYQVGQNSNRPFSEPAEAAEPSAAAGQPAPVGNATRPTGLGALRKLPEIP